MKKVLLFCLFLLGSLWASGEAFYIKNYVVKIEVQEDGSFEITERILVHFTEERRGIIRSIPFRYYSVIGDSARAERVQTTSSQYEIGIAEVHVEDKEFTTYQEDDNLKIRIGSSDVFITGEQEYLIRYKVWGALNRFAEHWEMGWNVFGTEWPVMIQRGSFEIVLPKGISLGADDVIVSTGSYGEFGKDVRYSFSGRTLRGQLTKQLPPYNGATVSMRFPKDYFLKPYEIDAYDVNIKLNANGSADVVEKIKVFFNGYQRGIFRMQPLLSTTHKGFTEHGEHYEYYIQNAHSPNSNSYLHSFDKSFDMHLGVPDTMQGKYVTGGFEYELRYRIWGSVQQFGGFVGFHFQLPGKEWDDAIEKATFNVELPGYATLKPYDVRISNSEKQNLFEYELRRNRISGTNRGAIPAQSDTKLSLRLPSRIFGTIFPPDVVKEAKTFFIENYVTVFELKENGIVHVKRKFDVNFIADAYTYGGYAFKPVVRTKTYGQYEEFPYNTIPDYSWFDWDNKLLLENTRISEGGSGDMWYSQWEVQWEYDSLQSCRFEYEYEIFDILSQKEGNYQLLYPVMKTYNEPVFNGQIRIVFPKEVNPKEIQARLLNFRGDSLASRIDFLNQRTLLLTYSHKDNPKAYPIVDLQIPKSYISKDFGLIFKMWHLNNKALVFVFYVFVVLLVLWFFIGRDKKHTLMVRYKPPKDITPAEAGLLWDGKLHKRDLVSLIYFWAGRGFISIEQKGEKFSTDYELKKQKDLPASAQKFEKTIFNKLFRDDEKVRVSKLKNTFYTAMKKAHRELEKYGKGHNFFVPGTRGFGKFLRILAWIVWGVALIMLLVAWADSGNYSLGLSTALIGVLLFVFGKIMPKLGHFGTKKFGELLGFREFIVQAEKERLESLLNENPRYFEETIAYAIVMGLGNQWAEKFDALLTEPPSYYSGYSGSFSASEFTNSMIFSMHRMEYYLNSEPKPVRSYSSSSGSSSSSWSSSSWSSSSSSSFSSGSSSFSSSGGYSGGGFGGGGGSSW